MDASTLDDAAVMRVRADLAIIQTADFITPIVDDPYLFGQIAAANSFSDVYAMGGAPLSAINLVCWPARLEGEHLETLLQGANDIASEANAPIIGGHTVADPELKYGLAVNGTVHPDKIVRNVGAEPGDRLFLTKPVGTGILSVALRKGRLSSEGFDVWVSNMCQLNKAASEAAVASGARAMTDVTGFGLAGHLTEMLGEGSGLGCEIRMEWVPLLPGVKDFLRAGYATCGAAPNREAVGDRLRMAERFGGDEEAILCDPQTSGGLLVAVPETEGETFLSEAKARGVTASEIGVFKQTGRIEVTG